MKLEKFLTATAFVEMLIKKGLKRSTWFLKNSSLLLLTIWTLWRLCLLSLSSETGYWCQQTMILATVWLQHIAGTLISTSPFYATVKILKNIIHIPPVHLSWETITLNGTDTLRTSGKRRKHPLRHLSRKKSWCCITCKTMVYCSMKKTCSPFQQ